MSKFKIGDKVKVDNPGQLYSTFDRLAGSLNLKRWNSGGGLSDDCEYSVFLTTQHPDENTKICVIENSNSRQFIISEKGLSLLDWQPQIGETIQVQDSIGNWCAKHFFNFDGEHVVCRDHKNANHFHRYENGYRRIPTTHTVTIGGIDTELSTESIKALKDTLNKLDL